MRKASPFSSFSVIAAAAATTVLSFAVLAQYFPKAVSGRANAALGVLNMGAAFGLQCLSGFIVALWPADGGRYPAEAHQAALGLNLVLQAAAFVWFIRPQRKPALYHLPAHPIHALATNLGLVPAAALSYARARHAWSLQMARAYAQQQAWRTAAFASFAVLALLASSVGSAVLGTSVAPHVIEGIARPTETRDFAGADPLRFNQSAMLHRPAQQLPVSLALSRSYGLTQGKGTMVMANDGADSGSQSPDELLWSIKTVILKTGLSRATIYRYTKRKLFPPPRRIGPNRVGWLALEVTACGWQLFLVRANNGTALPSDIRGVDRRRPATIPHVIAQPTLSALTRRLCPVLIKTEPERIKSRHAA